MTVDVRDRAVQYPSRYKLVLVEGTTDTYDFIPVPGTVAEAGTPINRALFEDLNGDIAEAYNLADSKGTVITGSYVGTGTYGEDNPNIITFPNNKQPKLVMIHCQDERSGAHTTIGGILVRGCNVGTVYQGTTNNAVAIRSVMIEITWSGSTVSWFNTRDADYQMNQSGTTYRYTAVS